MSRSRYDGRRRYSKRHDRYRSEWRARRDVVRHGIPVDAIEEYHYTWAMWTDTGVMWLDYTEVGTGKYSDEHRGRRLATLPAIRARNKRRERAASRSLYITTKRWSFKAIDRIAFTVQ